MEDFFYFVGMLAISIVACLMVYALAVAIVSSV